MRRQEFLSYPRAPKLWLVLDEAALRRPLGGREVMRGQVRRLIEATEQPNITLQIAPFSIGGIAAAGGPVTILRFLEPDLPDVVYLEQLTSALYIDKRDEVENYMAVMDRLCATAGQPGQTAAFLQGVLDEL